MVPPDEQAPWRVLPKAQAILQLQISILQDHKCKKKKKKKQLMQSKTEDSSDQF